MAFWGAAKRPYPNLSAEVVFWGAVVQACSVCCAAGISGCCRAALFCHFGVPQSSPYFHTAFSCARDHARARRAGCTFHPLCIAMCRVYDHDSSMALLPPSCDLCVDAQDVSLGLSQAKQESGVLSLHSCLCAGCGGNRMASLAVSALDMEQWLYLGAEAEESLQDKGRAWSYLLLSSPPFLPCSPKYACMERVL